MRGGSQLWRWVIRLECSKVSASSLPGVGPVCTRPECMRCQFPSARQHSESKRWDFCHSHRWERGYQYFNLLSLISKAYCFFLTCKDHLPSFFCELFVFLSIFLSNSYSILIFFLNSKNLLFIRETSPWFVLYICIYQIFSFGVFIFWLYEVFYHAEIFISLLYFILFKCISLFYVLLLDLEFWLTMTAPTSEGHFWFFPSPEPTLGTVWKNLSYFWD